MDTDVGHIGDKKDVTIESKEQYDTYFFSKVKTTLFVKKMLLWPKKSWNLIEDIIKNKETIIKLWSPSTEIKIKIQPHISKDCYTNEFDQSDIL